MIYLACGSACFLSYHITSLRSWDQWWFDRSYITWCRRFSRISRDQTVCNVLTRLLGFTVPLVFNGSRKLIGCQLPVFATLYRYSIHGRVIVPYQCCLYLGCGCQVAFLFLALDVSIIAWKLVKCLPPFVTFSCNSSFVLISLVIVIVM